MDKYIDPDFELPEDPNTGCYNFSQHYGEFCWLSVDHLDSDPTHAYKGCRW
jgi:hypothetical protein